MTPENKKIPPWARQERDSDLDWIWENLTVFWTAVLNAIADTGLGAIVIDTTTQPIPGAGNPFAYYSQEQVERQGNKDTRRMVREYDPVHELVVVLLKSGRISTYRVRALETENAEWDFFYLRDREAALAVATRENAQQLLEGAEQLEAEGAPSAAQELREDAELILQHLAGEETPVRPKLKPPDLETLMQWEEQGGCEAACPHQCWVEPDGTCPHGNPSWLLKLGLI